LKQEALIPFNYFGPISIFGLAHQYPTQIEGQETYQKRSIRNQMSILSPNGIQKLSIPLKKGKNTLSINQVEIAYEEDWVRDHLRSITTAYQSSSYYDHYFYKIEGILNKRPQYLFDLNQMTLDLILTITGIEPPQKTETYTYCDDYQGFDHRIKNLKFEFKCPIYPQVFEHKFGFTPNLSILDLLFNMGPEMISIIKASSITFSEQRV